MWEVILGTAAANKAASIGVGLTVMLGAAGTAEMTGIGPAVREIVVPAQSEDAGADEITVQEIETATEEVVADEEGADADHSQDHKEHFVAAADDGPGNLVWHERGGAFHLRGILVESGDGLAVRTAGQDGETVDLPIDAELVDGRIPGAAGRRDQTEAQSSLSDYVGYLVRASGECADPAVEGAEGEAVECTVTELHVLGNAGQGEGDTAAVELATEGSELESNEDASEEADKGTGGPSRDERGKPEHAGGPKHAPPSDALEG